MVKEKKKQYLKAGSWILVLVVWTIYFAVDLNESVKKTFLIISIIITGFSVFLTFGENIYKNWGKLSKEEIPKSMEEWEIREIIEKEVDLRWNNILKGNPIERRSKTVNGNTIYAFKLYLDLFDEKIILIVNANYRGKMPTVINAIERDKELSVFDSKITQEMINIAENPFDEPDREIIEEGLDQFKNPIRKTEKITQKTKDDKKKEELI